MNHKKMGLRNLWALIYVVVMMMIITEVESSLHRVGGGEYTWNPSVNFSDWATTEKIYSGDWLYFGFDETRHSILQVNKSSYEHCIDTDFIFNVTHVGRDVFRLLEPKPYYFICGRGYCHEGMKLAVLPQLSPSSPNVTTTATSTATTLIHSHAFATLATAILTFAFKALTFTRLMFL